jgi:hypothetical protein
MKLLSIRPLLALSVATLLTACGGNIEQAAQVQTAAAVQASLGTSLAVAAAPAASADAGDASAGSVAVASAPAANPAVAAQGPQPDCAPQACRGLRIIDGNAEDYRLKALRLAAADNGGDATL